MHLGSMVLPLLLGAGPPAESASAPSGPPDWGAAASGYRAILAKHVKAGKVDYDGLARDDLAELDRYLDAVSRRALPRERDEAVAFLVDAYNGLVLRSVIRHGKPRSVLDVDGFFAKEAHVVAGRKVTLDELEKKVLAPLARDPRTHFVLVCAAVSCPILESRPYADGGPLGARMEAAARRYLGSPQGARTSPARLEISRIFDWYAADFGGAEGVRTFVTERLSEKSRGELGSNAEIVFLDYNWSLNQR